MVHFPRMGFFMCNGALAYPGLLFIDGSLISLGLLDSLGALLVSGFLFSDGLLSSLGIAIFIRCAFKM